MTTTPVTVGVSLKMYFGHRQTLDWCASVAELAAHHPAIAAGTVELFVIPEFTTLAPAVEILGTSGVLVGAQDLFWEDRGAYTGEVSGTDLAEIGISVVEVGHAERRRIFAETDAIVAAKTAAALRNGIAPVLCIGEQVKGDVVDAAEQVIRQLESAISDAPDGRIIVAYEPVWAIGAATPADPSYIRTVCGALRRHIAGWTGRDGSVVIYGGSAGPGLLGELGGDADGLFLGRFAHSVESLGTVLDEAAELSASRAAAASTALTTATGENV